MSWGLVLGIAGLGVSAAGTYFSIKEGKAAAKSQRRSLELQTKASERAQRLEEIKFARGKAAQTREFIRKRASAIQTAQTRGASFGTAIKGGVAGLQNSLSSNMSFLNIAQSLGGEAQMFKEQASIFQGKAYEQQQTASTYGAIAGLGGSIFKGRKDIEDFGRQATNG